MIFEEGECSVENNITDASCKYLIIFLKDKSLVFDERRNVFVFE